MGGFVRLVHKVCNFDQVIEDWLPWHVIGSIHTETNDTFIFNQLQDQTILQLL